jgi:hypothetical protein
MVMKNEIPSIRDSQAKETRSRLFGSLYHELTISFYNKNDEETLVPGTLPFYEEESRKGAKKCFII